MKTLPMKTLSNVRNLILLAVFALVAVSQSHAQVIAIHNKGYSSGTNAVISETTGYVPVAAANWNNITTTTGTGTFGSGIQDSAGLLTSLTLSYSGGKWMSFNTSQGQIFDGYLDNNATNCSFTLSNIPYAAYDVYVYVASDKNGRLGSVTIGSETLSYTTNTASSPQDVLSSNPNLSYDINSDPAAVNPIANTLVFTGLTGSSLNISDFAMLKNGSRNGSGITSIEIVAVPEPSAFALLGLGLGFVCFCRIKRRGSLLA